MFDFLFNRKKNNIVDPNVLICSLGNALFFEEDKAIYEVYQHVFEFKAQTLSELDAFIVDRTMDIVHLFWDAKENESDNEQTASRILEILTRAKASLLICASENPEIHKIAALAKLQPKISIVRTLNRNGDKFVSFFKRIFELTARGKSLSKAWVTVAPQYDGPHMQDTPGCLYTPARGR